MTDTGPTRAFLTFTAGGARFAAAAADVTEILRRPKITRVPHGPACLLGMAGLRGAPAPVVSLARLLGREEQAGAGQRVLLLSGEAPIALAVDRVDSMTRMPIDADEGGGRQGLGRLYQLDDAKLRVLDLDGLLRRDFAVGLQRAEARAAAIAPAATPAEPAAMDDTVALLAFDLAGQAYALPLDQVLEVLSLPTHLAVVAEAEDAVIGVTALHGRVLPIVSLRQLLGIDVRAAPTDRVVAIRIGPAVIGLVVDRLRAIVRTPKATLDPAPAVLNRGVGEARVEAICRLPEGGLVAVLSPERLFRDEKTRAILADGTATFNDSGDQTSMAADRARNLQRFLVFRIGAEEYGLPLPVVDEVTRLPTKLTRAPKTPAFIEGVLNFRGAIIPVIDQRRRFAADSAPDSPLDSGAEARPRVIIADIDGRKAGFIVDAVVEILALAPDQLAPASELTADAARLFSRVASLDDGARLVLLVEPRELLDRAERDLLEALDAAP